MRYIDADALYMDVIRRYDDCDDLIEMIEQCPTADVRPNVHGKWIEVGYPGYPCVCSVCGAAQEIKAKFLFSFCPNCGCNMQKEVEP